MKKINLLFIALMLIGISTQTVSGQDAVYNDLDRTNWVPQAPPYSPTDNAPGIDGKVAGPEYLIDENDNTFLALVKPGKTYGGVAGPAEITDLWFTMDFESPQAFNYFRIHFRGNNTYDYLRPWEISIYGSNGSEAPTDRTWTLITDNSGNSKITLSNAEGNGTGKKTENTLLDNTTSYTSVKVVYTGMSPSGSGSTLQVAEFYLGNVSYDKVIYGMGDIAFGDVMKDASSTKTLTVNGANLNSELTYTLGGADAAAFSVTPGDWTNFGGTADITFSPTQNKEYTATLTVSSAGVVDPQTITLTGNADFELPVQISDGANEYWYYLQFLRQATSGTVITTVEEDVQQLDLEAGNNNQLWKITGTWDDYTLVNKANQSLLYTYAPVDEDPLTGIEIPEVNKYIAASEGDVFGFVRYQTTESWQFKNTSSDLITNNRFYLNDQSGLYVGGATLNNAGNPLRFISADVAGIIVPGDTVHLGAVKQYQSDTFSVPISSLQLTEEITASITKDEESVFSLTTTTLPAEGGDLEIVFEPQAYKKVSYATIALTSGNASISFVVSATSDAGISKYYVGTTEQWGTPVDGEVVDAVPSLKAGDVVWIAEGEYVTGQISVTTDVAIYGGFAGTEKSVDERIVADKPWEFANESVLKNSASLVMSISGADVIIDGITFEGTSVNGRAIQNTLASAKGGVIRNCIMKNFDSKADGGAMNIRYQTEIYNCLITNNKGNKGGAGYFDNVVIHDCEITNNSVPTDGAKPIGNINGGGGGILLAPEGVGCKAYNLYIAGNSASYGGGAYVRGRSILYNSIIVNNTAKTGSGVVFDERDNNPTVYNVTIANNVSTETGGSGICFTADGNSKVQKLYNAILWNNTDNYGDVYNIGVHESGAGEATPDIRNIIIDDLSYYVGENPNLAIIDGIAEDDENVLFEDTESWVTAETSPGHEKGILVLSEEIIDTETGDVTPEVRLEFATGKDYVGNWRVVEIIDIGPFEDQTNYTSVINPESNYGTLIKTEYYNLQGIKVREPYETGVFIKKEFFDTNKTRVTKILFLDKK